MPAPLDLTGRRFGALTVLRRDETMRWGREMAAWLCRCDCGAEVRVPQSRLPHRDSIPDSHRVTACDDCRSAPCIVCGAPIPPRARARTCSAACRDEHRRRYSRDWWRDKLAGDPIRRAYQGQRSAERYRAMSPEERRARNRAKYRRDIDRLGREEINARAREWHASRVADPDYAARRRERLARWQAEHPDKARRYSREWRRRRRALDAAAELGAAVDRLTSREERDDD